MLILLHPFAQLRITLRTAYSVDIVTCVLRIKHGVHRRTTEALWRRSQSCQLRLGVASYRPLSDRLFRAVGPDTLAAELKEGDISRDIWMDGWMFCLLILRAGISMRAPLGSTEHICTGEGFLIRRTPCSKGNLAPCKWPIKDGPLLVASCTPDLAVETYQRAKSAVTDCARHVRLWQ